MRRTGTVLGAHGIPLDILIRNGPQAAQHVHPRVAHDVRVQAIRRLHGNQAEQLQNMVLHHVPQRSGPVVVGCPSPHAFRFADRDLDVVDVLVVPDRFENAVGEPQHQEILHGLLAQIMVDAKDLAFMKDSCHGRVDLLRRCEIMPDRLFDDDARKGAGHPLRLNEAGLLKSLHDRGDRVRRDGEVENVVARQTELFLDLPKFGLDAIVGLRLVDTSRDVEQAPRKVRPDRRLQGLTGEGRHPFFGDLSEFGIGQGLAARRQHRIVGRKHPIEEQIIDGRHQLTFSEIARPAEDHDGTGLRCQ